jgi:hypothetical protein
MLPQCPPDRAVLIAFRAASEIRDQLTIALSALDEVDADMDLPEPYSSLLGDAIVALESIAAVAGLLGGYAVKRGVNFRTEPLKQLVEA